MITNSTNLNGLPRPVGGFNELPPIGWPAWTILILLILAMTATVLYVRSRTRIGFNDAPAEVEAEEDNTIIEAIRWRNEQESNNL